MATNNAINLSASGIVKYDGAGNFTAVTVTQYDLLVGGSSNSISSVSPGSVSGVPVISQGASTNPVFGTALVVGGGTGLVSTTAYALLAGGTTSTGNLQQISGLGNASQVLTSNGASALPTWQDSAVNPSSTVFISDDFICSISGNATGSTSMASELGWNSDGFNGGANGFDDIAHPGILGNAAISSSENYIFGLSGSIQGGQYGGVMFGGGAITMTFWFKIATLSVSAHRYSLAMGMTDSGASGSVSRSAIMYYTDNQNSGQWIIQTSDGSNTTDTNSSVTATTGWHKSQIVVNAAGTTVDYYIDGTHLGQITTTIESINPLGLYFNINGSATANSVGLDLVTLQVALTTPR